jgi:hypothetical protein
VSGGIAQIFLNLGTRREFVVSITPRPPLPRERPGTHCRGGWVGSGAGLYRCGKSRLTGIRSQDLPAHSESLYRLRYPGSQVLNSHCHIYGTNHPHGVLHEKNICLFDGKLHEDDQRTIGTCRSISDFYVKVYF